MVPPLASVIIPCFNAADTIAETIASVRLQTMQEFEILAIDNNSTDATHKLLLALAKEEPRLRVLQQSIKGPSATRNLGIRQARGKYIALLDADDTWDPDYLQSHLANLADGQVGVSYCCVRLIDSSGKTTGQVSRPKLEGLNAVDLLRSNPCMYLIVVPRVVFDDVGLFNEELGYAEDQDWLFRAAHAGHKLSGIDQVLASYRITPGSLSSNLDAMLDGHRRLIAEAEKTAPDLIARERRLACAAMLRYAARHTMNHEGGRAAARAYLFSMLRLAPDLILREPVDTMKAIVAVLAPGFANFVLHGRGNRRTVDA